MILVPIPCKDRPEWLVNVDNLAAVGIEFVSAPAISDAGYYVYVYLNNHVKFVLSGPFKDKKYAISAVDEFYSYLAYCLTNKNDF